MYEKSGDTTLMCSKKMKQNETREKKIAKENKNIKKASRSALYSKNDENGISQKNV